MCLVIQAEYYDTRVILRRVSQDVREVQVRSKEGTLLPIAHFDDPIIWLSTKGLLHYRMRVVPFGRERFSSSLNFTQHWSALHARAQALLRRQ